MKSNASIRIGDVHSRPVVVVEGSPYSVIAIDSDRISHVHLFRCPLDIVDVFLEWKFRRVCTNYNQSLIAVFVGPCSHIRKSAQPVDTRVRPEIDEYDFSAQARGCEWRRVEPLRCSTQRRKRALISLSQRSTRQLLQR